MVDTSVTAYLAYKYDTSIFLSWINESSRRCGWKPRRLRESIILEKPVTNTAPRLKGKERKKAKEEAAAAEAKKISDTLQTVPPRSIFSTAELIEQIELVEKAVTRQAAEPMPLNVQRALQRSIKARERFAGWYKSTDSCSHESLESHDHFINILKKATCLFQKEYDNNIPTEPLSNMTNQTGDLLTTNIFEALKLEDFSELDEPDEPEHGYTLPKPARTHKTTEFDIEPLGAELDFAIFSLLEDLHRIRAETQRIFRSFKAGEISIARATLSIAVALYLVRNAEEEALKVVNSTPQRAEFRGTWLSHGAYPAFIHRVIESKSKAELDVKSMYDFAFLPLGFTLSKFSERLAPLMKEGSTDLLNPIISWRDHYQGSLEQFGNDQAQSVIIAEDELLIHFYYEMRFIEDIKGGRFDGYFHAPNIPDPSWALNASTLPFYDIFHDALRPAWQKNTVSFETAFAARVMVDMHEICGTSLQNALTPPKEVTIYADRFGFSSEPSDFSMSTWVRDLELPNEEVVRASVFEIRKRVSHDLTVHPIWLEMRQSHAKAVKNTTEKLANNEIEEVEYPIDLRDGIWPHESKTFLMDNNLLYGGTAVLDLVALAEHAEIKIANHSFSIFCMAHIYNAARQLSQLDVSWPEMDRVIELQKVAIFANDLPTTPKEISTRFMYRTGLSSFSKMSRTLLGSGPRPWMLQPTPTSVVIREYFAGTITMPRMVHQIEEQATRHEALREKRQGNRSTQGATPASSTTRRGRQQVTLTKSLKRVEDFIDAVLPDMQFDYLNLTRTCNQILASLRVELISQVGVNYLVTESNTPKRSFVPAEMTLMMVLENNNTAALYDRDKRKAKKQPDSAEDFSKRSPIGPQLKHTAEFLKEFLTKNATRMSTPPAEST
ncbi:hypothetical protein F4781DRAFT_441454 [Annulohypoxylon bovei var. microspora]|nr:hypothetical protein F4781DRAFT_441454 [Annulohypoxylon bovei var. microspora]